MGIVKFMNNLILRPWCMRRFIRKKGGVKDGCWDHWEMQVHTQMAASRAFVFSHCGWLRCGFGLGAHSSLTSRSELHTSM